MTDDKFKDPRRIWRIVETDNYGGDYPNESFHGPMMLRYTAEAVADLFNSGRLDQARYYKVEEYTYKLQPGV